MINGYDCEIRKGWDGQTQLHRRSGNWPALKGGPNFSRCWGEREPSSYLILSWCTRGFQCLLVCIPSKKAALPKGSSRESCFNVYDPLFQQVGQEVVTWLRTVTPRCGLTSTARLRKIFWEYESILLDNLNAEAWKELMGKDAMCKSKQEEKKVVPGYLGAWGLPDFINRSPCNPPPLSDWK